MTEECEEQVKKEERKSGKSKKMRTRRTSRKRQEKIREPQRTKGRSFEEAGEFSKGSYERL